MAILWDKFKVYIASLKKNYWWWFLSTISGKKKKIQKIETGYRCLKTYIFMLSSIEELTDLINLLKDSSTA